MFDYNHNDKIKILIMIHIVTIIIIMIITIIIIITNDTYYIFQVIPLAEMVGDSSLCPSNFFFSSCICYQVYAPGIACGTCIC